MVQIRINPRVKLVPDVRSMGSIVARRRRGSKFVSAILIDGCDACTGAMLVVVSMFKFVYSTCSDLLVLLGGCAVAGCGVDSCVEISTDCFARTLLPLEHEHQDCIQRGLHETCRHPS